MCAFSPWFSWMTSTPGRFAAGPPTGRAAYPRTVPPGNVTSSPLTAGSLSATESTAPDPAVVCGVADSDAAGAAEVVVAPVVAGAAVVGEPLAVVDVVDAAPSSPHAASSALAAAAVP